MNIRDLKYLVALAEHQHFGKAAEASFVSQPALSIQIKKLEESLGIQLIERANKSFLFTDTGTAIVERARGILHQVKAIQELAKQAKNPYTGDLKLGIFPTLAPYLLPKIIPELSKNYEQLSFYLIEEQTSKLIEKLKNGKLTAAILSLPLFEKDFKIIPLFEEEFLLAVPSAHPLAHMKKVYQTNLDHKELLLLEEGHCMREQTLSICQKMNIKEHQNFRATSIETIRQMVAAGVGMTLMPKLACDNNKNITYIPFSAPKPTRAVGLVWRESTAKHFLLEEIALLIKNILQMQKGLKIYTSST